MSRTITVRVLGLLRAGTSRNGNPRWQIVADGNRSYLTKQDAQLGYCIDNSDRLGRLPADAELVLDGRGHVVDARRAGGAGW